MFCSSCGSQVNEGVKFCPSCGAPMQVEAPQPQPAQPYGAQPAQQPYGQQPMQRPVQQPFAQPAQPYVQQPYAQASAGFGSALAFPWKTNVGATILGIVIMAVINGLCTGLSESGSTGLAIAGAVLNIGMLVITVLYAMTYYPTFFTASPKMAESKKISFCNGFFGGIIFGCLWNSCLTKGKIGISQVVLTVIAALSVLSVLGLLVGAL